MGMKKKKKKSQKKTIGFNREHYLGNYPLNSRFAESYRTLRTNIQFSFMKKEFKCLLVSSATQSEGKTITVANLAYSLVQDGKSVLMVDTDLRKPSLSKMTSTNHSIGVTGLLSDVFFTDIGSGKLKQVSVEDLFTLIHLQKGSGRLKLKEGGDIIEFLFLNGKPVDMNWINKSMNKGLVAYLVKNELLTPDTAQEALLIQKQTGQKLAFVLSNTGFVKKQDLVVPLTIYIMKGFRTVLQFKAGEYSFRKIAESDVDSTVFDPVDYEKIYRQVLGGVHKIPFLQSKINSAVIDTDTEKLALLPSGSIPPNPSELLGSQRMSFLISNLKKKYDILIFDTPPVLPASDALLLAPYTDGVLLIVKAGDVNRELIKKAVQQFKMAQANLLGVILNKVDARIGSYYYKYYNKYYASYYGENR
jgi:capsular exopolysaccharide synthesis family protein